jgi:hypothetical protein
VMLPWFLFALGNQRQHSDTEEQLQVLFNIHMICSRTPTQERKHAQHKQRFTPATPM